ncbi:unnamed protein product [Urochloa humidicola]
MGYMMLSIARRAYILSLHYQDLDFKKFMDSCPEFAKSPTLIKITSPVSVTIEKTGNQGLLGAYLSQAAETLGYHGLLHGGVVFKTCSVSSFIA